MGRLASIIDATAKSSTRRKTTCAHRYVSALRPVSKYFTYLDAVSRVRQKPSQCPYAVVCHDAPRLTSTLKTLIEHFLALGPFRMPGHGDLGTDNAILQSRGGKKTGGLLEKHDADSNPAAWIRAVIAFISCMSSITVAITRCLEIRHCVRKV
jgi:hypothetical protein